MANSSNGPWSPLVSLGSVQTKNGSDPGSRKIDTNLAPTIRPDGNMEALVIGKVTNVVPPGSVIAWTRSEIWEATNWADVNSWRDDGAAPDFPDGTGGWEGEGA